MARVGDSELELSPGPAIPLSELVVRASRSSGPGGQHANKTETRVEVSFDVLASSALSERQRARVEKRLGPVVRAVSQDARSQARNREIALLRLATRLEDALRSERPRVATRPSGAAKAERLARKRARGETKALRRKPGSEG
jgi:ribosome-associated protein